ncbi:MAG: PEP-CTERM sorting domain-containing protein, partial [Burkholderiales bacterium]|nr:PEP-CTERM sorting domain-containing protein [Burkholderiales bacterium]
PAGYVFATGSGGSIGVTTVPVPEPQTAWLLLAGLAGLVSWRRAGRHGAAARAALRRWRPNHLPAAVALAAVCAAHAPAGATALVTAGAQVAAGNQGTSPVTVSQEQTAGLVGATAAQGNDTTETWVRQASATATASVGSLRVATQSTYLHAQGQPWANDRNANARASADASWTDTLLITSPTHTTGSGGHWLGMLALSADLTSVMHADKLPQPVGATVSLFATGLSGAPPDPLSNACDLTGLTCLKVFQNQQATGTWLLPVNVGFSYGQAFSVYVSLRANAEAQAYGCDDCTLTSTVANGTSLTWQGTSAILDASRHPVADATLSSESRFNYLLAAPVPEPNRALLTVLGALVIARRRRVGQVR